MEIIRNFKNRKIIWMLPKIVFLGDSHIQGVGAEWPKLYGSLVATPKKFKKNMWSTYLRKS